MEKWVVCSGGFVADWTTVNGCCPKGRFLVAVHWGLLHPVGPFSSLPLRKQWKVNSQSIEGTRNQNGQGTCWITDSEFKLFKYWFSLRR